MICVQLLLSAALSAIDLFSSRIFKKKIPQGWILAFDVAFCITFLIIHIAVASNARNIPQVYSNLAMLVAWYALMTQPSQRVKLT